MRVERELLPGRGVYHHACFLRLVHRRPDHALGLDQAE
jgi:hypothetical protein